MAYAIIDNDAEFMPLSFTRIGATWQGDSVTNTQARKLLAELKQWVNQYHHEDANSMKDALCDLERLFTTVWTEIDESLTRLSLMKTPATASDREHRDVAMMYLHRWQDRGGRIGNVTPVDWP